MTAPFFVDHMAVEADLLVAEIDLAASLHACGLDAETLDAWKRFKAARFAIAEWLIDEMARGTPPRKALLAILLRLWPAVSELGSGGGIEPELTREFWQKAPDAISLGATAVIKGTEGGRA